MRSFWEINQDGDRVNITLTLQKDDKLRPEDLRGIPEVMNDAQGQSVVQDMEVCLTGRGSSEAYAALGYYAFLNGARRICCTHDQVHECQCLYDRDTYSQRKQADWCSSTVSEGYQMLEILQAPTEDQRWPEDACSKSQVIFPVHPGKTLILTGHGSVAMYAAMGIAAAKCHPGTVAVRKPQEACDIYIDLDRCGTSSPPRSQAFAGMVIGILGIPNSGKSVFSQAFNDMFQKLQASESIWRFDCDFASRTPYWYRQLLLIDPEKAREQKEYIKQEWTPELQQEVAERLHCLRYSLDITLADMPGGIFPKDENGNLDKNTPGRPIPDEYRTRMLEQCDSFIVIGRDDLNYDVFELWRSALAKYGLSDRIIAEFTSSNPTAKFCIHGFHQDEHGLFKAEIQGLDRNGSTSEMGAVMKDTLAPLAQKIRCRSSSSEA